MSQMPQVLVVDDDSAVRRFVRACLERNGYRVLDAESGEEALAAYRENKLEIALVISDLRMPGIDGNQLAESIRVLKPSQHILFLTAYPGSVDGNVYSAATLTKPFSATQLLQKVAAHLTFTATA